MAAPPDEPVIVITLPSWVDYVLVGEMSSVQQPLFLLSCYQIEGDSSPCPELAVVILNFGRKWC
jgi:hypothetical protein